MPYKGIAIAAMRFRQKVLPPEFESGVQGFEPSECANSSIGAKSAGRWIRTTNILFLRQTTLPIGLCQLVD